MASLARLRSLGLRSIVLILVRRVKFRRLARRHGLSNQWHANSPYESRPYKREVVNLVDNLHPRVVVEVGCGLGEILSRVKDCRRFGFDRDASAVSAARELHGDKCEFAVARLSEAETIGQVLKEANETVADVLIMVNWPHVLSWPELACYIRSLEHVLSFKYLIMDGIREGTPGYAHYHSTDDLAALGTIISSVPSGDEVRDLHVVHLAGAESRISPPKSMAIA